MRQNIQFNSKPDIVCFKDKIVDLRTGKPRERVKEDYCSVCLPDSYVPKVELVNEIKEVREIYEQIFGDSLEEELNWLGYSLTGSTTGYNIHFLYGPSAQNGKNTVSDIFEVCFPIYYYGLAKNTFNKNNQKSHKQLIHLDPPVRLVTIHELKIDELDTDELKAFADAKLQGVEIMYGTSRNINTQCKLYITTNNVPKLQVDEGIKRRCIYNEVKNRFLPEDVYNALTDKTNAYIQRNIVELFTLSPKYRLACFHILLPSCMKYYQSGCQMPSTTK